MPRTCTHNPFFVNVENFGTSTLNDRVIVRDEETLQNFLYSCNIHENFAQLLYDTQRIRQLRELKKFVQSCKTAVSARLPMQPDPDVTLEYQKIIWHTLINNTSKDDQTMQRNCKKLIQILIDSNFRVISDDKNFKESAEINEKLEKFKEIVA